MYYEDVPQAIDLVRWVGSVKGSVAVFDPATIIGVQWGFKADSLALSDNAAVTSWSDSSGNGYTATQATGLNQPTFQTNEINSLPVVRFDGSNDRLVTASVTHGIGTNDFFYATVIRTAASLSGYHAITSNNSFLPSFYLNGDKIDMYLVGDKLGATALSTSTVYTIIARRISGTLEYYINGTIDANTFSDSHNIPDAISTLGDEDNTTASPWNSDIAEIWFGKTLSNTDRDNLTDYFRTKYAHY